MLDPTPAAPPPSPPSQDQPPKRNIWRWLSDWIAVRRPSRLVVDGVFLMFWGGFAYVIYAMWWQVDESALRSNPSRLTQALVLFLTTLHHALFNLGVVLVAAGCARLIGQELKDRAAGGTDLR
jgi:hypothetical protein